MGTLELCLLSTLCQSPTQSIAPVWGGNNGDQMSKMSDKRIEKFFAEALHRERAKANLAAVWEIGRLMEYADWKGLAERGETIPMGNLGQLISNIVMEGFKAFEEEKKELESKLQPEPPTKKSRRRKGQQLLS